LLIAGGAAVRHVLNVRFTQLRWKPAFGLAVVATVLMLWLRLPRAVTPEPGVGGTAPVVFGDVRRVIDRRCAACHSVAPSDLTFGAAPAGVTFDTPEQILARAQRINERAVVSRTMPPGNKTNITDAERDLLGRWFAQGATGR
jgi:uncharacterized membrane protein